MYIKNNNINKIYETLCNQLIDGKRVANTRELNNVTIELTNIDKCIVANRNISISYLCAELLWYFYGSNDVAFISKFAKLWEKISDDGKTSNSAYGFLLQRAHGFNQIQKIIELLKRDPNTRRAVLNINVPNKNVIETKDEPCTIALQFLIRDGKLNCTSMMRSNDIWTGFPYDIAFFATLQKYIAICLNVSPGSITHFVTSLHVYEKDLNKINLKMDKFVYYINIQNLQKNKNEIYRKIYVSQNPKIDIVNYFIEYEILTREEIR